MNATFWIIQIMLFLLKITGAWDLPWARVFVPGYLYISLLVVGVVKLSLEKRANKKLNGREGEKNPINIDLADF